MNKYFHNDGISIFTTQVERKIYYSYIFKYQNKFMVLMKFVDNFDMNNIFTLIIDLRKCYSLFKKYIYNTHIYITYFTYHNKKFICINCN